jgi:hypothetical protein
MHYRYYRLIVTAILLSPLWVGKAAQPFSPSDGSDSYAIGFFGAAILIGIPIIACTGLLVSFLAKKSAKAETISIIGYLIPAVLICIIELIFILSE